MTWRTLSEAVLQRAPTFGRQFLATSNARNEAMFKEASEFAQNIKVLEKDLKTLVKHMDGHFKNLRCILVSPLPRIYNNGPNGLQPDELDPKLLASNMEVEAIPRAADEARRRLQAEVLNPLHDWMHIYRQIADRMKVLEALRLELDSRRRTVDNLQGKLQRVLANMGGRHKAEEQLRETQDTIKRKEEKMDTTGIKFVEMEETVYNSLVTLVRDTAVLRDYTHCCLTIFKESFEAAAKAYDMAPQAPQLSSNLPGGYSQPENKYEAQLERSTPRGIGGLIDRLRGRSSSRPPSSPQGAQDTGHPDQASKAQYNQMYGKYTAPSQRMPSAYMAPQGQPMRNTGDGHPDTEGMMIGNQPQYPQPGMMQAPSGGYMPPAPSQYVQVGAPTYQQQVTGGYTQNHGSGKYPAATAPYGGSVSNGSGRINTQPSIKYAADEYGAMAGQQMAARYGGHVDVMQQNGMGWTQNGY